MKKIKSLHIILLLWSLLNACTSYGQPSFKTMKGITIVSPRDTFENDSFQEIKDLGADWICIVPFRKCHVDNFRIEENDVFGWWGLTEEGIEQTIIKAKEKGLKILLKPQLYLEDSWPGVIDFETDEEWTRWEEMYSKYINVCSNLAIRYDVEMFCVGTEIKNSVHKRKQYWEKLINSIRQIYKGKIIYSANWDAYEKVSFWNKLDYISISAYFPISDNLNAKTKVVKSNWKPIVRRLESFGYKKGKQIMFTEYGYLSVDRAAFRHWEHEDNIENLNINESAQANALEALFSSWWEKKIWAGGFLWKWYCNENDAQVYIEKDYSPQGKKAEVVIKKWFGK